MNRTGRGGRKPIKYLFPPGSRSGKVTVIERGPDAKNTYGQPIIQWKCRCDCGVEILRRTTHLKRGNCMCKDCKAKVDAKKWLHEEIWQHHWHTIQHYARKRGIKFNLSLRYVWSLFIAQNRKCSLSGIPIGFAKTKRGHLTGETTASLDRINSSRGYVKGNVQWLHKWVNVMKSDFTTSEFLYFCTKIATHQQAA